MAHSLTYFFRTSCSNHYNDNILVPTLPSPSTTLRHLPNHRPIVNAGEPQAHRQPLTLGKRQFNLSSLTVLILNGFFSDSPMAISAKELEFVLERYTDSKEGFTLLKPASWTKVDKAGATVLFEEPNKGNNNIGVVVNPVRLSNLRDFGTPEFVADKLIQAEKRKESTKEAEVIGVSERLGRNGVPVYEFEYRVDSTRGGLKRIFSGAFVASKKLYLLNIAHADKPEDPLDVSTRTMLEKVLRSFDSAPET